MFSNLHQGSQIYILHKSLATPFFEVGTVESITNMPMMGYYPSLTTYPIDVVVRVGEKVTPYQRIPMSAETVDVTEKTTGEVVTLTCTREALNREIEAMKQKSMEIINSVEYHRQRIGVCDTMLTQLNPEVAEKAAQQAELSLLKQQYADMSKSMSELLAQNKELMEQIKSKRTSSKTEKEQQV